MASKKTSTKKKSSKKKIVRKKSSKKKVVKRKTTAKNRTPNKKTKINPKGAGAQKIIIDWSIVNKLGLIQCTGEEIASVLNIDYDTLQNTCKIDHKIKFSDYLAQKKEGGKASLRRRQWTLMNTGNPTMCIWLGKQYLGQKDKQDFSSDDGSMSNDNLSQEQRAALNKLHDEEY